MSFPFFETLILSLLDVMQYYLITNRLHHGKLQIRSVHSITLLGAGLLIAGLSVSVPDVVAYFTNAVVLMAMSYILYRRRGFQLLFLHILGASLVLLIQLALLFPIYGLFGKIEYTFTLGLGAQCLSLALAAMMAYWLPIHHLYRFIETRNNVFRIVSLNLFLLLTLCVVFWYVRFDGIVENLVLLSAVIIIALLINLIFLREGLKNHIVEEQNRAYQRYLPIVNELMDDIRMRQHDFNNHLAALKAVLDQRWEAEDTLGRVESYIHEIESAFQDTDLLKMENRILAGFLYSKKKQAADAGISFTLQIEDHQPATVLKDYELLEILSILIDNAFETGLQDNAVQVSFKNENGRSVIEVSNRFPYFPAAQIDAMFAKGFSTKNTQKRGLGLYKLKQLVAEGHGEIEVLNRNLGENHLVFRVLLS